MLTSAKRPRLVGQFIRSKREALGISQRALGQLFSPAVTTQFISNVERGVTPLPPSHVATLTASLKIEEAELMELMEQEYTVKLSGRLGKDSFSGGVPHIHPERDFALKLFSAYQKSDDKTKQDFAAVCLQMLGVRLPSDQDKS